MNITTLLEPPPKSHTPMDMLIAADRLDRALIITGLHGNELTPLFVSYLLKQIAEKAGFPKNKFHTIDMISFANISGITSRQRNLNESQVTDDMNRDWNSSPLQKDKKELMEEIQEQLRNYSVIIDVHSSQNINNIILLDRGTDKNQYIYNMDCVKNGKIPFYTRENTFSTTLKNAINKNTKNFCFTYECDGLQQINHASAELAAEHIINILKEIDLTKELDKDYIIEPIQNLVDIASPFCGLIVENFIGFSTKSIKKGQKLFTILKPNQTTEDIFALFDGKVLQYGPNNDWVNEGDIIYSILVE